MNKIQRVLNKIKIKLKHNTIKDDDPHRTAFTRKQFKLYKGANLYILPIIALAVLSILTFTTVKQGVKMRSKSSNLKEAARLSVFRNDLDNENNIIKTDETESLRSISSASINKELPIGNITKHEINDPLGTVILIPQIHKNPGSETNDPANDSAQIAQKQIYDIIRYLNEKYGVDISIVEGELEGKVSDEAVLKTAERIKSRNSLADHLNDLKKAMEGKDIDPILKKNILDEINRLIKGLDRQIDLQGAPYKLKAENDDIDLYGSEAQSTREQSTVIVRDYIYLTDRINTLAGPTNALSGVIGKMPRLFNADLVKLLTKLKSDRNKNNNLEQDLSALRVAAQGDSKFESAINAINMDLQELKSNPNTVKVASASAGPSRANNPYNGINDKSVLDKKLKQVEGQINEVVIEQRNKDAAKASAEIIKKADNKVAILEFGAGHEAGMVKELNNNGLSVVVITPTEVLKR